MSDSEPALGTANLLLTATQSCHDNYTIQYNAVLSYMPYVAYSQTIRRRDNDN